MVFSFCEFWVDFLEIELHEIICFFFGEVFLAFKQTFLDFSSIFLRNFLQQILHRNQVFIKFNLSAEIFYKFLLIL